MAPPPPPPSRAGSPLAARRRLATALLGAALSLALPASAVARGRDLPEPEWREGPVRYLLTRDEDKAYKSLKTEQERRRFIERFWRRRDPTPETVDNEFRDQFWRRVAAANGLFEDTAREGWISDRGKIYVLLGPPDDVVEEQVARSHRGIIIWSYRTTWAKDLGPNVVIAFARDVTGEFRISTAPSVDADVFRGLAPSTPVHLQGAVGPYDAMANARITGIGTTDPYLRAQGVPSGMTELGLLADLGRLQQTDQLILSEIVSAQALFGELPMIARADYYKASDGTTYAALSVFLRSKSLQYRDSPGGQAPDVVAYARLEEPGTGELRYGFERDRDFVPGPDNARAGVNDYLVFQAGAGIAPGRYKARFSVHDRVAQKVGRYEVDLDVPDFQARGLALSSLTLADRLEPVAGAPNPTLKSPFVFGNLRVIPKPGIAYGQDQEFAFYFQAYQTRLDAATGRPLLDVRYRFLRRDEAGSYQPLGQPIELIGRDQAAQGYAFPLSTWPIGQYRLVVEVTDRLSGERAERTADFVVR